MDETFIVVMLKEKDSGFLVKEIGTYAVNEYSNYLVNINAEETDDNIIVNMKVMYDCEIEDWEYNAICDYYDTKALVFDKQIIDCIEIEDCYEPTWEVTFVFSDNDNEVEELIHNILEKHHNEILDVLETIKDKKEEYNN